jgi:hypothetical protein
MPLPGRQDINVYDSLDERCACEHFLGKSLAEAEALFRESPIYYQGDMMWMGAAAFRYYLPAAVQFIRSEAADSDFVAHFSGTLEFRLEHEPEGLIPVAEQLVALCRYVIEHWSRFEDVTDAYGDIRTRFQTLQQAFSQMLSHDRSA